MSNNTAIARRQEVFVMEETTRGTLVAPAASGLVIAAGSCSINQQPSFTDSANVRNSRDVLERFQDRTPPADWSLPVYLTPSGSPGVAPQEGVLLKSLLGKETVNGESSVVYAPNLTKPSFSLWVKKDHTVFFANGCTTGSAKFSVATKDGAKLDLSGKGMRMGWAGTDATAALLASSATSIQVDSAKKYTVGAFVEFVESGVVKDNVGAGYELTAIDTTTNIITFANDPAEEEIASGSIVRGWLPTGTEIGAPLENRKASVLIDSTDFPVQSLDCSISDDPKYLDDEITASGYVEDYAEIARDISGSISIYFRESDVKYFDDGIYNTEKALSIVVGDTAGSTVTIAMPTAILDVPTVAESDPTLALSMGYKAMGNVGEDSISITYA